MYIKPLRAYLAREESIGASTSDYHVQENEQHLGRARKRDILKDAVVRIGTYDYRKNRGSLPRGFVRSSSKPLTLLVDIKKAPTSVLPVLEANLRPLSKYLTRYDENGNIVKQGRVRVVLSGDLRNVKGRLTQFTSAAASGRQGIFFIDGRVKDLKQKNGIGIDDPSHAETTPVVSFDYRLCGITSLIQGKSRSRRIREITSKAHKQGKKVRVFACPNKEGAWDQVFRNNVDIVSVDDHERFRKYCAGRLNDEGGSFL